MRKVILILFLSCFALLIYGCRPSMPSKLCAYVELLERVKLRGISSDFFVEVTLYRENSRERCRLTLIPARLGAEDLSVEYTYGSESGFLHGGFPERYTAVLDYDGVHSAITLKGEEWETVPLIPIAQTPANKLLMKAYSHFEDNILGHASKTGFRQRIHIKILADMDGNAFFYVGFIGDGDYYAALFDIYSLDIAADYYK